jgi:WD40 repeat protein
VRLLVVVAPGDRGKILRLEVRRELRLRRRGEPELDGPLPSYDDGGLRESFDDAFAWARSQPELRPGSITHWRLLEGDGSPGKAAGRSAGGAMALALAYLHGLTSDGRRPFNRRMVLSAVVAPDGTFGPVKEFRDKVPAVAAKGLTLLVSPANLAEAKAEQQENRPPIEQVADVPAALSLLRVQRSRHPYWIVPTLVAVLVVPLLLWGRAQAGAQETSRRVAELVSIADRAMATDPGNAIVAVLAAHARDPQDGRVEPALVRLGVQDPRLRGTLPGTPADVVAVSPDGGRIAVGGAEHSVRVQAPGGGPYRTARWGGAGTSALAFTSDGRTLISAAQDGTIVRWDVTKPVPQAMLVGRSSSQVGHLTVSPGGRMLAVLDAVSGASVWDLRRPQGDPVTLPVPGPTDVIFVDDDSVAVTSDDKGQPQAAVYSVPSVRRERLLLPVNRGLLSGAYGLAVGRLADGRRVLAAGARLGHITVWETGRWQVVRRAKMPSSAIRLALGRDSDRLVVAYGDAQRPDESQTDLEVWDLSTGHWLGPPLGEPTMGFRGRPQIDAAGRTVAALTSTRHVTLWSVRPEPALYDGPITAVATDPVSPRQAITAGYSGLIKVVDLPGRRVVQTIDARAFAPLMSLGVAPDGRTLVTGHTRGRVVLWNRATGRPDRTLTAIPPGTKPSTILSVGFDSKARRLATGSLEGNVRLWSLPDGRPLRDIRPVARLAARRTFFDERNDQLIIGYDLDAAQLVPLNGGRPSTVPFPRGVPVILPLSAEALLLGDNYGELRITDHRLRPSGTQPSARHTGTIMGAAISPDRRWWLTAGEDATGRITDAASGAEIAKVFSPESARQRGVDDFPQILTSAAFSGDGRYAVLGSARGRMVVLDLNRPALIRRACAMLPRDVAAVPRLSAEEREKALSGCR